MIAIGLIIWIAQVAVATHGGHLDAQAGPQEKSTKPTRSIVIPAGGSTTLKTYVDSEILIKCEESRYTLEEVADMITTWKEYQEMMQRLAYSEEQNKNNDR